ncbi:pyridoxamine 5'-phosphate oxidase-like protein [Laceyella sediminis]|nr:pyridoxamine 5'-phosphate oxidase family protein [Laceyella sediminis]PRZ14713.1 pyridoxamine 5'-phosphate oxidase-like protein [Laceyella sediminis]
MNPNRSTCPFHALLNKETSRPIRRKTKRLHDEERVRQLLHSTRVGYLGLVDAEGTYVVPLNYVWYQDAIYFHGSEIGRKADALSTAAGPLCFTVAQEY